MSTLVISMFCFVASAFADQSYSVICQFLCCPSPKILQEARINFGPCVYFNNAYGSSWIMHCPGFSFIEMNFNKEECANGRARFILTHLSSVACGSFYSPVTISVNDVVVASGFSPNSNNYITDTFDLTGLIQKE